MGRSARARADVSLLPSDPSAILQKMVLGIGQAAAVAGVSVRQLSYWTDKSFITAAGQGKGRAYDWPAIEKAYLVKQGLDKGCALDAAVAAAEELLRAREDERRRVQELTGAGLRQYLLHQADMLQQAAQRMREQVNMTRSSRLGELALAFSGMETLIRFLERNPHTATTAAEIAARLGQAPNDVQAQLEALEQRRLVQRLRYPRSEVWRYTPQRAG